MTHALPFIIAVNVANRVNARAAMAVIGQGPDTFSRPMAPATPEPVVGTPPAYYLTQDMGGTDDLVVILNAMTLGTMPEGPWGEDGNISEADAIAAFGGGNVIIRTGSGLALDGNPEPGQKTPEQWRDDTFAELGWSFIPEDV